VISHGIQIVGKGTSSYPAPLLDLDQPPDPFFAIGDLDLLKMPRVSIVGTRNATSYGLRSARAIATAFATRGFAVVSGLARGIDAASHRAALESGGTTIAVLGTGVDVPYPVGHSELHRVIGERGLLIAESLPGSRAHKGAFPKRNRIIAALAPLTIVVECGHKSGAQNTARHVMALDRLLAAVPGPIDSPQSAGTNQLLRDGAHIIATVEDALVLAGVRDVRQAEPVQLCERDARVWAAIGVETLHVDEISARSALETRECLSAITSLELAGMVESLVTGEVRRR